MAFPFPGVLIKHAGIDFNSVDLTPQHALGIEVDCDDGTRRKYVRAGSAIAAGDVLTVDVAEGDNDYQQSAAAADLTIAGAWPSAYPAVADNSYFWCVVRGVVSVKAAAAVVAGAPVVTIATAGTVDDTAATAANALASGSGIGGIFVSATSGGFARVKFL